MSLDLLIELGTEELPPTELSRLSQAFTEGVVSGLKEARLVNSDQAQSYATPRRLAVLIPKVLAQQADQQSERRGPAVSAAFDDAGTPTPAALGFAKSCGVPVEQLDRLTTEKGEWLSYQVNQPGQTLEQCLSNILPRTIKRMPIHKRMRWGTGTAEFVRPAHWLVVLHGDQLVPVSLLGLTAGKVSRGHRFHGDREVTISQASDYAKILMEQGAVVADFKQRQNQIKKQITQLAESLNGSIDDDSALLDEVTGLVEKPQALLGSFHHDFLSMPPECLISAMRDHQKYFHLRDRQGQLLPNFITVSNIDSQQPQCVVAGNERVINARLSDARFFWDTDRKRSLSEQVPKLSKVMFHAKLGTLADKSQRLQLLATKIAELINADATVVTRAAELAKADLVTDMVGEFDKLQGLMGHYYADADGEPELVGTSIEQHYWPRFAGDRLPESPEAQALALADKIDSVVGIFGAGETASGDKDPYGLRRAALGVLRILIEQRHPLNLQQLIGYSAADYAAQSIEISAAQQSDIVAFIDSRLTAYYRSQGVTTSTLNAVLACYQQQPLDFDQRLRALQAFSQLEQADELAQANKRINNILSKNLDGETAEFQPSLLQEDAEVLLNDVLNKVEFSATKLFDAGDYQAGLQELVSLAAPLDDFFEQVMVMTEDEQLKANRLSMLSRLRALFLRVADIALLQN